MYRSMLCPRRRNAVPMTGFSEIGEWEMTEATYGMGGNQEFQAGEVIIIFDFNQLIVQNEKPTNGSGCRVAG